MTIILSLGTWAIGQGVTFGPTLGIYGGYAGNYMEPPFVFSWGSRVNITGSGWLANEAVTIHLRGPLDLPGIAAIDRILGTLHTDSTGVIANDVGEYVRIPYDGGVIGYLGTEMPDIPRPGRYEIYGIGSDPLRAERAGAPGPINLSPQTVPFYGADYGLDTVDWARSRGGRDGFIPDDHSPELTDPEWMSVWDKRPVQLYATVASMGMDGGEQPAKIATEDYPRAHYGHDANLLLVPDPEYLWLVGTANFNSGPEFSGRIELEWEIQNDGTPYTYGHGPIGLPLWAMATVGDRVFTVGRWVMDQGHPAEGDRTEIHPPRLLATMRKRHTAVPLDSEECMTRASQVDIFVSGHGGGVNHYHDGLDDLLDNHGRGGGRIEDFMPNLEGNSAIFDTYYARGPSDSVLAGVLHWWYGTQEYPVWSVAGPSGIATDLTTGLPTIWDHSAPPPAGIVPWTRGPEERNINDMDYDFDVPLPPPPAGATAVRVQVTTHPEHKTRVSEEIAYTDPDPVTGLPTVARIHLPYNGADNDIYARTLKFYWDRFNPPGDHYVVKLKDIHLISSDQVFESPTILLDNPGRWNLWTDVSGQWVYLTGLNPGAFNGARWGDVIGGLDGPTFDVYLDPEDTLRVYTFGHEPHSIDSLLGADVGKTAYQVGADIVWELYLGSGENVGLGGALFDSPSGVFPTEPTPSSVVKYPFHIYDSPYEFKLPASLFTVDFTVDRVPAPQRIEVAGPPLDFDKVTLGSTQVRQVQIFNGGDDPLDVDSITVSGEGFYIQPHPPAPYTLLNASSGKLDVFFSPSDTSQGVGTLTIDSNDPCRPSVSFPLCAEAVPTGVRMLALRADGTPYPVVDQITLTSDGVPPTKVNLQNVPLTTISPPMSCETRQYHYEAALPPNNPDGRPGSYYDLRVRVGARFQTVRFTLGAGEFKEVVVTLQ